MQATVVFSVVIDTDRYGIVVDESKRNDSEYMDSIKNKIKDAAASVIQTSSIDAIIHECDDCPELID